MQVIILDLDFANNKISFKLDDLKNHHFDASFKLTFPFHFKSVFIVSRIIAFKCNVNFIAFHQQ